LMKPVRNRMRRAAKGIVAAPFMNAFIASSPFFMHMVDVFACF